MTTQVETTIDRLAAGGDGIGRMPDGRTLFVPLTAPGDRARVEVVEARKRFARGRLVEVIEPGPGRAEPPCAVFGKCGGCSWQHLGYDVQLEAKRSILVDAVERIGHLSVPASVAIEPSPAGYGYRSRARLHSQGGRVGYRRERSHALCAVNACPVLVPELEGALGALAERVARGSSLAHREWELVRGETSVRIEPVDTRSRDTVDLDVGADRLRISPGVFFQANALLIERLHGTVLEAACRDLDPKATAVELFAGAGFFTFALGRHFARVVAVEAYAEAAADLRANRDAIAPDGGIEVRAQRVEPALEGLLEDAASPAVVLLDPPRAGLSPEALIGLVSLAPRRIVYLSCDPATLARDLAALDRRGYRLGALSGFDLFPQTPHVEALAVLEAQSDSGVDEAVS